MTAQKAYDTEGKEKNLDAPSGQDSFHELWNSIKSTFPKLFGEATYKSWLAPLAFKEFVSGRFVIAAPTSFMRDWVSTNCKKKILGLLQELHPTVLLLDVIVDKDLKIEKADQNHISKWAQKFYKTKTSVVMHIMLQQQK